MGIVYRRVVESFAGITHAPFGLAGLAVVCRCFAFSASGFRCISAGPVVVHASHQASCGLGYVVRVMLGWVTHACSSLPLYRISGRFLCFLCWLYVSLWYQWLGCVFVFERGLYGGGTGEERVQFVGDFSCGCLLGVAGGSDEM
jgi:hypothetical protein